MQKTSRRLCSEDVGPNALSVVLVTVSNELGELSLEASDLSVLLPTQFSHTLAPVTVRATFPSASLRVVFGAGHD